MSSLEFDNRGWNPTNRQPGKKLTGEFAYGQNIKECPHYTLIEICALLAEVDPLKDEFCGQKTEKVDDIGILSGFRGTIYHPQAMCAEIHDKLEGMVAFVQKEVPLPIDTSKLDELLASKKPNEEKEQVLKEYNLAVKKQEEQRRILELWQNIIFKTCCLHASDNVGNEETLFRRVESPTDLPKDEVMKKINFFLAGLKNQVTGERQFDRPAEHCPQAPKRQESGMRS